MSNYGIKETLELLDFVIVTAEEAHIGLKDGPDMSDLGRLFTIFKVAPAAFSGVGDVPDELMDLDNSEYDQICAHVKEKFDIAEDDIENVVEHGFVCVIALVKLYNMIGDLRKKNEVVEE